MSLNYSWSRDYNNICSITLIYTDPMETDSKLISILCSLINTRPYVAYYSLIFALVDLKTSALFLVVQP